MAHIMSCVKVMTHTLRRRAVFLDRDGTINVNRPDHVKSLDEFELLPGAIEAIRLLSTTPLAIIIVTNQSAINRGLAPAETVDAINGRLAAAVRAGGGRLDGVYYCPHRPDEQCECRKPRPGLLLQAQAQHDLDLADSYVVGDAVTDVDLALAAGCRPVLVLTGRGGAQRSRLTPEQERVTHVAADLAEAARWICREEAARATAACAELA